MVSPLVVKVTGALATKALAASFTVAVAVEVEAPSAGREDGLRATVTAAGVANSVRVAVPDLALAVAVIVSWSAVTDALTVTVHVPEAVVVHVAPAGKMVSPLVVKVTRALATKALPASFTVAVAVEVEAPSAGREDGLRATVTAEGVANSVRVAVPDLAPEVAVIVSWSAVVEAFRVTEQVPNVGPEEAVVHVALAGEGGVAVGGEGDRGVGHQGVPRVFHRRRGRGGGGAVGRQRGRAEGQRHRGRGRELRERGRARFAAGGGGDRLLVGGDRRLDGAPCTCRASGPRPSWCSWRLRGRSRRRSFRTRPPRHRRGCRWRLSRRPSPWRSRRRRRGCSRG